MQELRAAIAETAEANHRTESALRRGIEFSVREARVERERRREADDRLGNHFNKMAAAQLVTEEKLQRFLESRTGHNGS